MPGVLVVHENRGLNPYIEDVARRVAVEGFLAFAPDALTPLGGYPGNDEEGKAMQAKRKPEEITEDFVAAAQWLQKQPGCNGKVGVVGFCFGGGMANTLAVRLPDLITAAVPFYGRQPAAEDVPKIKASLLLHYAELDQRVNEGWPAYEAALKAAGVATPRTSTQARTTAFTTTPRRATTKPPPSSPGRARSSSSKRRSSRLKPSMPAKKKPGPPLTGAALLKETCRRIRAARSLWDAHNNRACRGERVKALALYEGLSKCERDKIPRFFASGSATAARNTSAPTALHPAPNRDD